MELRYYLNCPTEDQTVLLEATMNKFTWVFNPVPEQAGSCRNPELF
jgi:hypothetical protein